MRPSVKIIHPMDARAIQQDREWFESMLSRVDAPSGKCRAHQALREHTYQALCSKSISYAHFIHEYGEWLYQHSPDAQGQDEDKLGHGYTCWSYVRDIRFHVQADLNIHMEFDDPQTAMLWKLSHGGQS